MDSPITDVETLSEEPLSFDPPETESNPCPECGEGMEKYQLRSFDGEWLCPNCDSETLKLL